MMTTKTDPRSRTICLRSFATRVFAFFVAAECVLFLLDVFVTYWALIDVGPLRDLVDMTRESCVATWLSTTQFLVVSGVLLLVSLCTADSDAPRWRSAAWMLFACFFCYMSFDDGAKFHERIGTVFGMANGLSELFPSYTWQLVFLPFFGAVGLLLLIFLKRELDDRGLYRFVIAGLACYVAAVLLDFVEGNQLGLVMIEQRTTIHYTTIEHFARAVEELLELFGTTLLLRAFAVHLARVAERWQIGFAPASLPVQSQ